MKPSLKFDVSGVGHDPAKEFTDHWWDVAYTKAARRIDVTKDESTGDVTVKSRKRNSKQQKKEESKRRKQGLYAKFVKSATLTNGQEVQVEEKQEQDKKQQTEQEQERIEEEEEERQARAKVISRLTDEELFDACDGMTAHK